MFDNILILIAKIGLTLVAIVLALRWLVFIPYILFVYDRPILKLKSGLDEFRKKQRARPVAMPVIDGSISHETQIVSEKLEILEMKRRHFLDRVNMFLTISSIKS